ncbi:TPA: LPXTG cell wall anchor domain-containing protein [Streptococcus agalactiae]|nr:LPXTG cell wall anchor domain-containing protein [Streptococcus agalactiae]
MTQETKQIFSIRKFKTGTHSALLAKYGIALAASAVLMGAATVSADEVTASQTQPATEQVAPATTEQAPVTAQEQPAVTSDIPTSVPANTTQEQAVTAVDDAQVTLKDNVATATDAGVVVKEGDTQEVVINDSNAAEKTSEVLTDLNKQDQAVKEATALQEANQKAYNEANTAYKDAKSEGVADLELADGRQNQVVDLAKKNDVPINVKSETVSPVYTEVAGLEGDALLKAIESNIAIYKQAVADSVSKQDASTKEAQAKLDAYLKALADYNAGIGTQSGIKWADNTTVEAGTAQRMTGDEPAVSWGNLKTAAADAIQSLDRNQNTDAKFDNIFKINGTGTVIIKNTTNGDVTLKISNIQAWTAENTYLAVWGSKDGGIAWGVFATTHGTVTGGAGEGATGGNIGASGAILASVKSYDYEVSTSNPVSTVTFNDVDNNQTVAINGLDGANLVKGRNISQSGNSYSAGAGDVSQASGGVIDSNGVQFNFDEAKRVIFSGTHFLPGYINTSIVAGIFGVASEVPKEPKKPTLEVTNYDVELPDAPEAPTPVEVEVHYYKLTTTPAPEVPTPEVPAPKTPVTPASVLPSTGEEGSMLAVLGGALFAGLSLVGLRKRKEN